MSEDIGKLVVRLLVGVLLLFHGWHKLVYGVGFIGGMLSAHGLPGVFAYCAYLGEFFAPVLIIAGVLPTIGGILVTINMIVAVVLVGGSRLFSTSPMTGGYALELEAFYLFGGVAVIFLGAGRFSLGGGRWTWRAVREFAQSR